jgi:hypothetical protein
VQRQFLLIYASSYGEPCVCLGQLFVVLEAEVGFELPHSTRMHPMTGCRIGDLGLGIV